jgi:hypothetical protein
MSGYPNPHYDDDDTCQCPDHVAMREEREEEEIKSSYNRLLRMWLPPFEEPK